MAHNRNLSERRKRRLNGLAVQFQDVDVVDLLPHLTNCLTERAEEAIEREYNNKGKSAAANKLRSEIKGRDNWYNTLLDALEKCSYTELKNWLSTDVQGSLLSDEKRSLPSASYIPSIKKPSSICHNVGNTEQSSSRNNLSAQSRPHSVIKEVLADNAQIKNTAQDFTRANISSEKRGNKAVFPVKPPIQNENIKPYTLTPMYNRGLAANQVMVGDRDRNVAANDSMRWHRIHSDHCIAKSNARQLGLDPSKTVCDCDQIKPLISNEDFQLMISVESSHQDSEGIPSEQ